MKTEEIKGLNSKGENVTYLLKRPSSLDYQASKLYSNKLAAKIAQQLDDEGRPAFLTRSKVRELLTKTGDWNSDMEAELVSSAKKLLELERKLARGGIKKSEGKTLAIEIKSLRVRQLEILAKTRNMDEFTLEAQVENANFDYLIFSCILNEEGDKVFKNVEEYKESGEDPIITNAAVRLAEMLYGYDANEEKNLPENKFLMKYGFVDKDLKFIDKDGHYVDSTGRKIDEKGRLVNDNNELVDINNEKLDNEGNPIEEFQEFIDD
jgi:hypothetical protein